MMVATITASAQREAGAMTLQPKLGFGLTSVTNYNPYAGTKIDKSVKVGGLAGIEFEYQLTPMFSLAAAANYTIQGAQWSDYSVAGMDLKDITMELQYVNVPIVLNAYLFQGFAVKAGLQFGLLTSAKTSMETKNVPGFTDGKHESEDFKKECKKLDISIPFGASYEFSNVVIDARYNLGLTKINKEGSDACKNSVFMLTFGYKFDI